MLAKLTREMPPGGRRVVRAEVGRLPLHRVPRRRRPRSPVAATRSRCCATSPSCASRCSSSCPERVVLDGELVVANETRSRLRRAAAAPASGRVARAASSRSRSRRRTSRSTCSRSATTRCSTCRSRERRAALEQVLQDGAAAALPHAGDARSRHRRPTGSRVRRRRLRRCRRQAARRRVPARASAR